MNTTPANDPLGTAPSDPFVFELAENLAEFGVIQIVAGPPRNCRWSAGLHRLLGVDGVAPESDLPLFVEQYVIEKDRARVLDALTGDPGAVSIGPTSFRICRADGVVRRIRSELRREQDDEGRTIREIMVAQDVTAMREAHDLQGLVPDRLLQVSRLSALGEMAASIAHEINQPLAAIATYAQALGRLIRGKRRNSTEVIDAVDEIAAQALRAGAIVNHIRQLSQHVRTDLVATDLNAIVREFGALAQAGAQPRRVAVHVELGTHESRVRADAIQLQQLLLLLVGNALDAIDANQSSQRDIRLTTRPVEPNAIEVSVEDTGGGIRPDILPRLFEAFVSSKPLGTGLGLLTCRRIVHAHGGELGVENRAGHGARFYFSLPLLPPRVRGHGSAAPLRDEA